MKRLLVMLVAAAALAVVAAPAANAQEPTIVYTTPESGATAAEACRNSDNVVLIQLVVDGVAQRVSRPTAVVRGDRWGPMLRARRRHGRRGRTRLGRCSNAHDLNRRVRPVLVTTCLVDKARTSRGRRGVLPLVLVKEPEPSMQPDALR
jgi:hypothetical protein